MGTIGNQPVRPQDKIDEWDMVAKIDMLKKTAKLSGCKFSEVIEIYKARVEERKIDVMITDGDYRDEHMGGIGDCLDSIAEALRGQK